MRKPSKASVWKLASEYNRRKAAMDGGYVKCVCCGKIDHWKSMDAGHFVPKSRAEILRYEPDNIHAQCVGCNRPQYSCDSERSKIRYTLFMVNKYGEKFVRELEEKGRLKRFTRQSDLDHWADFYRAKLAELDA